MKTHPIVRQIVDRHHVADDYLEVVRSVLGRLRGRRKAFLKLPREARRTIIGSALQVHKENRDLFNFVMRGVR